MPLDFRALRRRRSASDDSEALKAMPPSTESDVAIQAYGESLTGRSSHDPAETADAMSYISFVKGQCKGIPGSLFAPSKGLSLPPNALATETQIFRALAELATSIKASPQWSVNDGINALATAGVFRVDLSTEDIAVASQLVFAMSGYITMLFAPLLPRAGAQPLLHVEITGTRQFLTSSQSTLKAERPLVEVLKGFGEILPVKRHESSRFYVGEAKTDTLMVANLNIATLVNIGGIHIIWVKSISSHLEFDSFHQRLSLFCVPAFCMLNLDGKTPCESILKDFYEEDAVPKTPSQGHPLFKEILLSYKLLFADDRRARTIYLKKERERAQLARGTPDEPCLDNLCGMNFPRKPSLSIFGSPLTISYSKDTDFPLLADRLSELQSYISSQQPDRLTALWHDRRNLLSWYTFWAVLIFGAVGIACSIIQTVLAVVQTAIAWKTYQAQLASVPTP